MTKTKKSDDFKETLLMAFTTAMGSVTGVLLALTGVGLGKMWLGDSLLGMAVGAVLAVIGVTFVVGLTSLVLRKKELI